MNSLKLARLLIEINESKNGLVSFLKVIDKNKLNYILPNILESLKKIESKELEENKEIILSSYKLGKETRENIISKYKLTKPENIEDRNIITGFKIYTKDKIVDASLNTILKKFTK